MWILSWIPDFVFHIVFVVGVLAIVAGYFLDNIPFISANAKTIQVAGILLTVLGVWFEGGIARDQYYREKIAELQAKIAKAEVASAEANAALAQQLAKNEILVKENNAAARQRLQQQAQQLNAECKINKNIIGIINDAAKNRKGSVQ